MWVVPNALTTAHITLIHSAEQTVTKTLLKKNYNTSYIKNFMSTFFNK